MTILSLYVESEPVQKLANSANREPVPDFPSYGGYATEASQVKQLTAIAKVLADKGAI